MFKVIKEDLNLKKDDNNFLTINNKSKLVYAVSKNGIVVHSNPNLCAERVLLNKVIYNTQKKGKAINLHNIYKEMNKIEIYRYKKDGSPGCCIPCLGCRHKLRQLGICVTCFNIDGQILKTKISDINEKAIITNADKIKWNIKKKNK